jgi:hypothetical protein
VCELQDIEEGGDDGEDSGLSGSESDSSDGSSDDEGFGEEGWVDKKGKYMFISVYVYVLVHICMLKEYLYI